MIICETECQMSKNCTSQATSGPEQLSLSDSFPLINLNERITDRDDLQRHSAIFTRQQQKPQNFRIHLATSFSQVKEPQVSSIREGISTDQRNGVFRPLCKFHLLLDSRKPHKH